MVEQFALLINIIGLDTVRADDGLALSSRNGYLTPEERAQAPQLQAALHALAEDARSATAPEQIHLLEQQAMARLDQLGWTPDYLTLRRRTDLQTPTALDLHRGAACVVLGAARLGRTRLIDNLEC
jgi:pantoate--beta-alanine ligase